MALVGMPRRVVRYDKMPTGAVLADWDTENDRAYHAGRWRHRCQAARRVGVSRGDLDGFPEGTWIYCRCYNASIKGRPFCAVHGSRLTVRDLAERDRELVRRKVEHLRRLAGFAAAKAKRLRDAAKALRRMPIEQAVRYRVGKRGGV